MLCESGQLCLFRDKVKIVIPYPNCGGQDF